MVTGGAGYVGPPVPGIGLDAVLGIGIGAPAPKPYPGPTDPPEYGKEPPAGAVPPPDITSANS